MSRANRHQSQLRDQFTDFTHTTTSIANNFLRAANWDLELAINNFLSHTSGSGRGGSETKSLAGIFDKYQDPQTPDTIGIDGTLQYLEDLGYDPENKVTLALAEFLESPTMGVFHKRTFLQKWQQVRATSLADMKAHIDKLNIQLNTDPEYLKKVYRFTFTFLLEEGQKTLPLETASDYWRLLFADTHADQIEKWIKFLEDNSQKTISRDTWNMFFMFLQEWSKDPELKQYDENAAWPSLIDEFVEDFRERQGKKSED